MHWVLQHNVFREDKYDDMIKAIDKLGCSYSQHTVVPFVGELLPDPDFPPEQSVICMGSLSMRHVATRKGWYPGVFDVNRYDFEVQRERWGRHMLNYDARVSRFEDARFESDSGFIRPTGDNKQFSGMVTDRIMLKAWQEQVCKLELDDGSTLRADTMVETNRVLPIYREVRYWIVKGEIVTSSVYKTGRRVQYFPNIDDEMDQYVRDRVGEWQPTGAFVIDIAETPDGLKIIEINTLNSCGLYACDPQKLVFALEEAFG